MNMSTHRHLPPAPDDIAAARMSCQLLSKHVHPQKSLNLQINGVQPSESIEFELPATAVSLLMEILDAMAAGRGVTIIPEGVELTTVEAAEILNVSRPYLIKLLEEGQIPFRKVGTHRRILMDDVMNYKKTSDAQGQKILDELTAQAQALDMGYSKQ